MEEIQVTVVDSQEVVSLFIQPSTASVLSVNGNTGDVVLDPDDLDDTATTNKFVTASDIILLGNTSGTNTGDQDLSGKQDNITLTTTGTSGAATFAGDVLNIPQYSGGGTSSYTVYSAILETAYIQGNQTVYGGVLEVGKSYKTLFIAGSDDFTNIGWVTNGVAFVATGTTPNVWTSGSIVFNITDSVLQPVIELENTTGGTFSWIQDVTISPVATISGITLIEGKTVTLCSRIASTDTGTAVVAGLLTYPDTITIKGTLYNDKPVFFELRIYP